MFKSLGEKIEEEVKFVEVWHVNVLIPHDECTHYMSQTSSWKIKYQGTISLQKIKHKSLKFQC